MSGGAHEYVMGVYNNTISNSGFSSLPDTKYYNNYTGSSYTGHALTETKNWYSDSAGFVNSINPWFMRGGNYGNGTYAGVFYFSINDGNSYSNYSSRLKAQAQEYLNSARLMVAQATSVLRVL